MSAGCSLPERYRPIKASIWPFSLASGSGFPVLFAGVTPSANASQVETEPATNLGADSVRAPEFAAGELFETAGPLAKWSPVIRNVKRARNPAPRFMDLSPLQRAHLVTVGSGLVCWI